MTNLQQSAQALSRLMLLLALQMTGVIVFFVWGAFSLATMEPTEDESQLVCGTTEEMFYSVKNPQLYNRGKELFFANCASCHSVDMKRDLTGPALGGLEERWADFPREELYRFIRETQDILNDPEAKSYNYANALYTSWNKARMNSFGDFTDAEIEAIITFTKDRY